MTKAVPYLEKRSLRIAGLRTSVALEPPFWAAVEADARRLRVSIPTYIASVDAERPKEQSLASALRCAALKTVESRR